MILGDFSLDLVDLGLEFVVGCLGAHVLFACGYGLRVNGFVELQFGLFFLFFAGESVPFACEPFHLSLEIGQRILLVPNLDELLLSNASPRRLDLSLESGNSAKLFLLILLILLMQLFRLLAMDVLISDRLLNDRADQLLQLVHLGQQFSVLEHQAHPIPQGHLDSLLWLGLLA